VHFLILICGWGSELADILFAKTLECKFAKICLTFMILQGVIPPHNSLEKERNQPGNHVKLIQMLLKHLFFAAIHPFQMLELKSFKMGILERYVCVLYDKTTLLSFVNELRKELFCKRSKAMEAIPPRM